MTGAERPEKPESPMKFFDDLSKENSKIKSYDMRVYNKNLRIYDQKNCGVSWAFSAIDVASSYIQMKNFSNKFEPSVELLLSCNGKRMNNKWYECVSRPIDVAWNFLKVNG